MTSTHFERMSENLREIARIYLGDVTALGLDPPSAEQQEMARAFMVFAHAEIEWYSERICIDLLSLVRAEAANGRFSGSTLALLAFSSIESLGGGESLSRKKVASRTVSSRVGNAVNKHEKIVEGNEGVREKHLAKLFVPLGLASIEVDSAWLADLDTFASHRGAFAHMSRSEGRASPLAVNPADAWMVCERLVWGGSAVPGMISSFQELDGWFVGAKDAFSQVPVVYRTRWGRLRGLLKRVLS